jgi:hypothetical protein
MVIPKILSPPAPLTVIRRLLSSKRIKQWTFYRRDEVRIAKLKRAIVAKI